MDVLDISVVRKAARALKDVATDGGAGTENIQIRLQALHDHLIFLARRAGIEIQNKAADALMAETCELQETIAELRGELANTTEGRDAALQALADG